MMQKRQTPYIVAQIDDEIDRAVQKAVPAAYRGSRRASVRYDYVLRDWLSRPARRKVESGPPTP